MAARLKQPGSDAALRKYLLGDAKEFRRLMVDTLLDDAEWAKFAWFECSKAVDRLASGAEHRFHGWELPDDHPARMHGVHADFVLGADDVLRAIPYEREVLDQYSRNFVKTLIDRAYARTSIGCGGLLKERGMLRRRLDFQQTVVLRAQSAATIGPLCDRKNAPHACTCKTSHCWQQVEFHRARDFAAIVTDQIEDSACAPETIQQSFDRLLGFNDLTFAQKVIHFLRAIPV